MELLLLVLVGGGWTVWRIRSSPPQVEDVALWLCDESSPVLGEADRDHPA